MGHSVVASCSCGYESGELMIGGGRSDFQVNCSFPAYCREGDHLVSVNMFDDLMKCPDGHKGIPTPYNDGSLIAKRGQRRVSDWHIRGQSLELTNGAYLCPQCHEFKLTFDFGGTMFD